MDLLYELDKKTFQKILKYSERLLYKYKWAFQDSDECIGVCMENFALACRLYPTLKKQTSFIGFSKMFISWRIIDHIRKVYGRNSERFNIENPLPIDNGNGGEEKEDFAPSIIDRLTDNFTPEDIIDAQNVIVCIKQVLKEIEGTKEAAVAYDYYFAHKSVRKIRMDHGLISEDTIRTHAYNFKKRIKEKIDGSVDARAGGSCKSNVSRKP